LWERLLRNKQSGHQSWKKSVLYVSKNPILSFVFYIHSKLTNKDPHYKVNKWYSNKMIVRSKKVLGVKFTVIETYQN
jgi:hypothetical protein